MFSEKNENILGGAFFIVTLRRNFKILFFFNHLFVCDSIFYFDFLKKSFHINKIVTHKFINVEKYG
ncbi:MAG: hypothetical protein RL757_1818 [Bacteroidota bacterium]|jgi:hypothetical protein